MNTENTHRPKKATSLSHEVNCPTDTPQQMGFFERYLTVWVGFCIFIGITR